MGRKVVRKGEAPAAAGPIKITLSLDAQTVRQLRALAGFRGCKPRDVLLRALAQELSRFVVYERPGTTPDVVPPPAPPGGPERPQDEPLRPRLADAG